MKKSNFNKQSATPSLMGKLYVTLTLLLFASMANALTGFMKTNKCLAGLKPLFIKQFAFVVGLILIGFAGFGQTITTGDYRTTGTASFSSATNWQTYNTPLANSTWQTATVAPAAAGGTATATSTVGTQFKQTTAIGATVATITGVTTTASTAIVLTGNTTTLAVGQTVSGTTIPVGATIATITDLTHITISSAATAGTNQTITVSLSTTNQITGVTWSANASYITFNSANLTGTPVAGQPIIGTNIPAGAYIYSVTLNGASSTLYIGTNVVTPAAVSITTASSSVTLSFGSQQAGNSIIELQSTAGISVGMPVSATGVAASLYVTAIGVNGNSNCIQISGNPTSTHLSISVTIGGLNTLNTSTYLASVSGIAVGNLVVGTGIPAGTTVSAINGNRLTFSQGATASESATTLKFYSTSSTITNMFINHNTTVDASNTALITNLYINNASSSNAGTSATYTNATLTIGSSTTAQALTVGNLTVASSASVVVGAFAAKHTLGLSGGNTTSTIINNSGTITLYNSTTQYCSVFCTAGTGTSTISNGTYTFNDLTVGSGTTLVAPSAMTLYSNLTNNGTFTAGTGTVTFNGAATIGPSATMPVLYNLTIGAATVSPSNSLTVTNLTNLSTSTSILVLAGYTLTTGSISGGTAISSLTNSPTSYISVTTGKLIVNAVPATATLFPMYYSTTPYYLPISFSGTTNTPNITVAVSNALTNTPATVNNTVKAQWAVTASAICNSTVTFQYDAGQSSYSASTAQVLGRYYSSAYSEYALGTGSSVVTGYSGAGPYSVPTPAAIDLPASIVYFGIGNSNSFAATSLTTDITLANISESFGAANFTLSATSNNSGGAITYTSGNTSVATISGSTVTITGVGTSLITVSQAANGNYTTGSTTATLTVSAVAPATPTISNVSAGNMQATITFAESNWGGNTGTYTITPSSGSAVTGITSSPYTFNGLTNGTSYTFTVTAINSVGSATSSASSSVTPNVSANAPTSVSATGGNAVATITFTPPSNATASSVDNYIITPYLSGVAQTPVTDNVGTGITAPLSYTVTGLQAGGSYTFTVAGYASSTNLTGTASSQTSPAVVPTGTYTWTGSTSTDYQVSTNWSPSRGIPSTQDVLEFTNNTSNTVTNVLTQTIARLVLTGTTAVSLQAVSGSSTVLSVGYAHTSGVDEISVPSGCTLTLATNADGGTGNTFTLGLANVTGVTSNIAGTLTIEPNATATSSGAVAYSLAPTTYTLNELVTNSGNLYKVTTAGTAATTGYGPGTTSGTATVDGTGTVYFAYVGTQYMVAYSLSTTYSLGQLVTNGSNLYQVTTAGTSATSGSGPVVTTGTVTDGTVVFTYVGPSPSGNFATAYSNVYDVHYGITTVTGTVNYAGKFNNTSAYTLTTTNTLQFSSGSNFNNQREDAAFPGNGSATTTLSPYYNNVNVTFSGAAGALGVADNVYQFPASVNTLTISTPNLQRGASSSSISISSLSNSSGSGGTFAANTWNEAMQGSTELVFGANIEYINIGSGGVNISSGTCYFAQNGNQYMTVNGNFTLSGTGGFTYYNSASTAYTASLTVNNFTQTSSGSFQLNQDASQTGASLTVKGNFSKTAGTFTATYPATLIFAGTVAQTFSNTGTFTGTALSLTINNTGTASGTPANNTVTLNSPITIGGTLNMTKGVLVSSSSNYPTVSGISGGSGTAYINGLVNYASAATSAFTLPLGSTTAYTPITITPATSTAATFQVQYAPLLATGTINSPLLSVNNSSVYSIALTSGTMNGTVSFPYTFTSGIVHSTSDLVVAANDGTSWSEVSAFPTLTGSTTSGNISDATAIPFSTSSTFVAVGSIGSSTNLTTTYPSTTYTWIGGTSGSFQTAANWSPTYTTPAVTDILQFDGSNIDGSNGTGAISVTSVPTGTTTIGQLVLLNNASVSLQATSGGSSTLTAGSVNATGDEISVPSGCTLTLATNADGVTTETFTLGLANVPGVTSNIAGTLTIQPNATTIASGAVTYTSGTTYSLNQLVVNDGNLYNVTTAGTAAASGYGPGSIGTTAVKDPTGTVYFTYVGTQYAVAYQLNTTYSLNQYVSNGANLYQVTTVGTSATSGSGPVVTTGTVTDGTVVFTYIAAPYTVASAAYQLNTTYSLNQYVSNGANLYQVTTAGTSATSGSGPVVTTGSVTNGTVVFTYISPFTSSVGGIYATGYNNVYDAHYGITTVTGTVNYAGKFNNTSVYTVTTNTLQFNGATFNNLRYDVAFPGTNSGSSAYTVSNAPYYNNVNVNISGITGVVAGTVSVNQFPASVNALSINIPNFRQGTTASGSTSSSNLRVYSLSNNGNTFSANSLSSTTDSTAELVFAANITTINIGSGGVTLPSGRFFLANAGNQTMTVTGDLTLSGTGSFNYYWTASSPYTASLTVNNFTQSGRSGFTLNTNTSETAATFTVKGNFVRTAGTFAATYPATISFAGSGAQTFSPDTTIGNFNTTIQIANTGGHNVTLGTSDTIYGTLKLTSGNLVLGSNNLVLASTATLSPSTPTSASYIDASSTGLLTRDTVSTSGSTIFPIGTSTSYTPLTITPATANTNLAVGVLGITGTAPNTFVSPVITANQVVNLQWSVLSSIATTATIKYQYNASNGASGYVAGSTNQFGNYIGTGYYVNQTVSPTGTPYTFTVTGLSIPTTGVNDYVVGNAGAVESSGTNWTGTLSTDWGNYNNWDNGVPNSQIDATIVATTKQPLISATTTATVRDLIMNSNTTVINNNVLNIGKHLTFNTTNGTISGTGTTYLTGSANVLQNITGSGIVGNLTLNSTYGATVGSSSSFGISGVLTLTTGTLTTNGNVTLKSLSIANSGVLAPYGVSGNTGTISGNVTVERYIPAGYRGYRDLAPQVYNSSNTMFNSWQENGSFTHNGYGIFITGPTSTDATLTDYASGQIAANSTTGLDYSLNGISSAYTYGNGTWPAITNTKTTTLDPLSGYRVLVRGDRSFNLATTPILIYPAGLRMYNATTLRATGSLVTGTVTYSTTGVTATANGSAITSTNALNANATVISNGKITQGLSMVANPYACPVSWTSVYNNSVSAGSNINGTWYFLDPTYGATGTYEGYNYAAGSQFSDETNASDLIQAGQAFFVLNATTSPTPKVVFEESAKQATSTKLSIFGAAAPLSKIYVELYNGTTRTDGAAVAFRNDFTNDKVGSQDAYKLGAGNDNISVSDKGVELGIDGRLPATASDAIALKIGSPTATSYQLQVDASRYINEGFTPLLYDAYKNTTTALGSAVTTVNFTVDANTASYANRFTIIFTPSALAVNSIVASATLNDKVATITWNTVGEKGESYYSVEKSTDGKNFTAIGQQVAKNTASASYTATDNSVVEGNNYYRIKAVSETGSINYSNIAKVQLTVNSNQFTVYPNPLVGKTLNVSLGNVAAGKYVVCIYNVLGEKVNEQTISHSGGSATHAITINNTLAGGVYSLVIREASSNQIVHQASISVQP